MKSQDEEYEEGVNHYLIEGWISPQVADILKSVGRNVYL